MVVFPCRPSFACSPLRIAFKPSWPSRVCAQKNFGDLQRRGLGAEVLTAKFEPVVRDLPLRFLRIPFTQFFNVRMVPRPSKLSSLVTSVRSMT
jgi:hypothetical protein